MKELSYYFQPRLRSNFLVYIFFGLISSYACIFLAKDRLGWAILLLSLIAIYLFRPKISLFIFFHLIIFENLIYNPKTQKNIELFLISKIRLTSDWVSKTIQTIDQLYLIFIIAIILIEFFIHKRRFSQNLNFLFLSVSVLVSLLFLGFFVGLHEGTELIVGLQNTTKLFLSIIAFCMIFPKLMDETIMKYLLFMISGFQVFLILVGWFPVIMYSFGNFSGDFIVGTTNTSTSFVYLLSIAFIYFFFVRENIFERAMILIAILFMLFLAQSVAQTFVLFSVVFVGQLLLSKSKQRLQMVLILAAILILGVLLFLNLADVFPYLGDQLKYAEFMTNHLYLLGFADNPKIQGIISITNDYMNSGLDGALFGIGGGAFAEKFGRSEFLVLDSRFAGMGRTIYTPINIIFYDFGILAGITFVFTFVYLFKKILSQYRLRNSPVHVAAFCITLLLFVSYLLFPLADSTLITMTASILIAYSFLIYHKNAKQNN